jgi:undecaprenyl pyrophosphate phosphatase UppP
LGYYIVSPHKGRALKVTLAQNIVLGILRGVAEVFPISPGGHIIFIESMSTWSQVSRLFEFSVQVGALLGIVAYFWKSF